MKDKKYKKERDKLKSRIEVALLACSMSCCKSVGEYTRGIRDGMDNVLKL